jgi:UDPglucose 6-dehydrogenase
MTRPVCIVGLNHLGLTYAIGLAELGWNVRLSDTACESNERLHRGGLLRTTGIGELFDRHAAVGRIRVFDEPEVALRPAGVVLICSQASVRKDRSTDISAVRTALERIAGVEFEAWPTVVLVSAVPPGTGDVLKQIVRDRAEFVHAPEFLYEGSAVRDFIDLDRIVVGCESPAAGVPYATLFERLGKPVVFTSLCNAELIKCTSSALVAMQAGFAGEVAALCDALGGSADDVLRGIGYDRRIGQAHLTGYANSSGLHLDGDARTIAYLADRHGVDHEIVSATMRVNERRPNRIVEKLERELGSLVGLEIGVWGLALRSGIDALSDPLALRVIEQLSRLGARAKVYDPVVRIAPLPPGCRFVPSPLDAALADVLVVLTDWPEFGQLDPRTFAGGIARALVVDGRNVLDPNRIAAAGLTYRGVGRFVPASPAPLTVASWR